MTSPVAVIARFMPRPDARSALRALLDAMITPTRAEDGCRSYDLYESADGGELVLSNGTAAASRSTSTAVRRTI